MPARHIVSNQTVIWEEDEDAVLVDRRTRLDDATRENGCLQYVPGSHGRSLLPKPALAGSMDALEAVLTPAQRADFKPVAIELARGQASFHHPLMVHGSLANVSNRPGVGPCSTSCGSASDDPMLEGVPAIPSGTPLGGQFFPLLSGRCDSMEGEVAPPAR